MKTTSLWKKIVGSMLIIIIILFIAGTFYVQQNTYTATNSAQKQSEQAIHAKKYDLYTSTKSSNIGIIFYPGAFVAPESYSKWASQVALAGYNVYVLHIPLNLAFLGQDAAQPIMEEQTEETFILAGHSLGGVVASRFTAKHPEEVAGMIFLASYPDKKGNLKHTDLSVLSITASKDGVLNIEKYQKAKRYMPQQTEYIEIKGGNHAGFGAYGVQKGDSKARTSNNTQQTQISHSIIEWLEKLEEK